jgi:hypothetical protein
MNHAVHRFPTLSSVNDDEIVSNLKGSNMSWNDAKASFEVGKVTERVRHDEMRYDDFISHDEIILCKRQCERWLFNHRVHKQLQMLALQRKSKDKVEPRIAKVYSHKSRGSSK